MSKSQWTEVQRRRVGISLHTDGQPPNTFNYFHSVFEVMETNDKECRVRIENGPAIYEHNMCTTDADWFRVAATAIKHLLREEEAATKKRGKAKR